MNSAWLQPDRLVEEPLKLQVVVVYEDFETGLRAKQLLDQTAHQLPGDANLEVELWRFDILRDVTLWEGAVRQAARANLLLVSAHGWPEMPSAIRFWLEKWCGVPEAEPRALVISLDAGPANAEAAAQALERWAGVVPATGMQVFLHLDETKTAWAPKLDELYQRAHAKTAVLDQMLHEEDTQSFRHWGINE